VTGTDAVGTRRTARISPHDLLRSYTAESVRRMARMRGSDVKAKGKEALVEILAPDLFHPDRVRALLPRLAPAERRLLDELVVAEGAAWAEAVRTTLVHEELVLTVSQRDAWGRLQARPAGSDQPMFEDVVASLKAQGLIFSTSGARSTMTDLTVFGDRLFLPQPILEYLPRVTLSPERVAEPAAQRRADPGALLRDVYTTLSLARETPLSLTARGQIAKRTLAQLDELFQVKEGAAQARTEEDLARLSCMRAMAQEAGLLEVQLGALALTDGAERFLQRTPGERLRRLYEAYRQTARWYEVFHVPGLAISLKGAGRFPTPEAIQARQRVLSEIAELPVGQWVSVRHVVERMRRRAYEFLMPRDMAFSAYGYWSAASYGSNLYRGGNTLGLSFDQVTSNAAGWDLVEGGFIRVIVTNVLHWLGAIDLGFGEAAAPDVPGESGVKSEVAGDFPVAIRLTDMGAALLRGQTPALAREAPRVVIQPNFQVFAFPPTDEEVLFALDRLAERVRSEQVVEYRLTREALYQAQRGGLEMSAAIAFLERVAMAPLPQNVRRTLEEWGAQLERVVIRRGSGALQAANAALIDSLRGDGALGSLLGARLTPMLTLVKRDDLEELRQGLLERGVVPALSEGADELHPAQLNVTPDGRILLRHRVPSIYVQRAVGAFADSSDSSGAPGKAGRPGSRGRKVEIRELQLTVASLRRAARAGLTAESVTATLVRWHKGPLPAEVVETVRRWGKDWGKGALANVILLRVRDAETLTDLLHDEEIGPSLRPLAGAPGIALVQRSDARMVRASLQARGMELREDAEAP